MKLFFANSIEDVQGMLHHEGRKCRQDSLFLTFNIDIATYCAGNGYRCEYRDQRNDGLSNRYIQIAMEAICETVEDENKYLCQCMYHRTGSGLQCDIDEVVFLISNIMAVMENYKIDAVIITNSNEMELHRCLLRMIAKQMRIQYKVVKCSKGIRKNHFKIEDKSIMNRRWFTLKVLYVLKNIKVTYSFLKRNTLKLNKASFDIGILFCCNEHKNLNWLLPLANELKKDASLNIICIGGEERKKDWERKDFSANNIEDTISYSTLVRAYRRWRYIMKETKVRKMNHEQFRISGINVSSLIECYIFRFLYKELFYRMIIDEGVKKHLEYVSYKCIHGWSSTNSWFTRIAYYNVRKLQEKVFFFKLYETHPLEKLEQEPEASIYKYNYISGNSMRERRIRNDAGITIIPINSSIWKVQETEEPKISNMGEKTVFWAPGGISNGTEKSLFIKENMELLEGLAQENCTVLVKFHPMLKKKELQIYYEKFGNKENISFITHKADINEYYATSDIVISDVSTVLLDGIMAGKVVMSLALGTNYERVKEYKELLVFNDTDKLLQKLHGIFADQEEYEKWYSENRREQQKFIENEFIVNDKEPLVQIREDIMEKIRT